MRRIEGASLTAVTGVPDGSIIVAGYRRANGEQQPVESPWLRQYDSEGNLRWTNPSQARLPAAGQVHDVACDRHGNILLAGVSPGAGNNSQGWLHVLRPDATTVRTIVLENVKRLQAVFDSQGAIIVHGFRHLPQAASTPGEALAHESFLSKYGADGSEAWTQLTEFPGQFDDDLFTDLAVDGNDDIVVMADLFVGLESERTRTGFERTTRVEKHLSTGSLDWRLGPLTTDAFHTLPRGAGMAIGPKNQVVITGHLAIYRVLGAWIQEYSPRGRLVWLREYTEPPTAEQRVPLDVAVTATGDIVSFGFSALLFGLHSQSVGQWVETSRRGETLWTRHLPSSLSGSREVILDPAGNILLRGSDWILKYFQ
jgi:hypothetical protein